MKVEEKKIFILVDDEDYRKGVEEYLEYNTEAKSTTKIISGIEQINERKGGIKLITDKEEVLSKSPDNLKIYRLVDAPDASGNKIYKYGNFEDILKSFIDTSMKPEENTFDIYTISSSSPESGKTLVAKTIAEILGKRQYVAYLNPINKEDGNIGLSELLLMNEEGNADSLPSLERDFKTYIIPGFALLRDYIELEVSDLRNLFKKIAAKFSIRTFIIEIPDLFSKSSEKIIGMSDTHIILNDFSQKNRSREITLLKEYSSSVYKTIELNNLSPMPQRLNDLPKMRFENPYESLKFNEKDYLFFKHKIAQNIGIENV